MVVELQTDFVDEIEELESLYDAALHQLTQECPDDALSLFRGVVHECDKLLRQSHGDQSKEVVLRPAFYLVYGNALYRCGLLDCDLHEHMEVAIEQYQLGLEKWSSNPSLDLEKLHHAMAFILLHKASNCTDKLESSQALATAALQHIHKTNQTPAVLLESALALQKYADIRSDLSGRKEWNESAVLLFKRIPKDSQEHVEALVGLGNAFLSQANYYADAVTDEEDVCIDAEAAKSLLEMALNAIDQALEKVVSHAHALALKGEILVYKANIRSTEDDSEDAANELYQQAVDCFKQCQEISEDALPDRFLEFVRDLEDDEN